MKAEKPSYPGGDPAPILVSADVVMRHMRAAIPEANRLLPMLMHEAEHKSGIKPYENALAFGLALRTICAQFGWKPRDILDLLDQVTPS